MPNDKFLMLILSVVAAAALTVWVGFGLVGDTSSGWSVVLPVVMAVALALRFVLMRGRKDDSD